MKWSLTEEEDPKSMWANNSSTEISNMAWVRNQNKDSSGLWKKKEHCIKHRTGLSLVTTKNKLGNCTASS